MGISQTAVLEKFRQRMGELTGMVAAYAPSQSAESSGGIPPVAALVTPCAIVLPGKTLEYILTQPRHRHTYEVRVLILVAGADYTENIGVAAPMPDRAIEQIVLNVTLGGTANSAVFRQSSGLGDIEWGGRDFIGYELTFEVSETASASAGTGT